MTRLAEAWVTSGVRVTLATFDGRAGDFYLLREGIVRRSMRDEPGRRGRFVPGPIARTFWLRSVICETSPDAVISFTDRTCVVTLLASIGLRVPVIVSERTDPEMYSPGRAWEYLRRILYPSASAIVVLTEKVRGWSQRLFPRVRTRVIPNPVPGNLPSPSNSPRSMILAVGRLEPEKGFDSLIDAFSQIAARHPDWRLRILGEGQERQRLEQRISALGLVDRVEMPGRRHDVLNQLAEAGIFVLSSRFEGFPNALVEALACGRAGVSTNCSSGPSDLIEHEQNGLLVPVGDSEALAAAMERLLVDPALRVRLGQAALQIRDRLSISVVMRKWNDVLSECGCQVSGHDEGGVHIQARAA